MKFTKKIERKMKCANSDLKKSSVIVSPWGEKYKIVSVRTIEDVYEVSSTDIEKFNTYTAEEFECGELVSAECGANIACFASGVVIGYKFVSLFEIAAQGWKLMKC